MSKRSTAAVPTSRSSESGPARAPPDPAIPSPTELKVSISVERGLEVERGVDVHRNLDCGWYDRCLDEAFKNEWKSWTCRRCALHSTKPDGNARLERYATQRPAPY